MRVFSFRDLLLIPELSQFNEIELLYPHRDDLVNKYLSQLGFDLDYAVQYLPAKHRDMQGNVGVGYRAVGEISINRNFINSPLCSITERLIAAYYLDPSLTQELTMLMGHSINYRGLDGEDGDSEEEDFPADMIEPDYEDVLEQIKTLEAVRDMIRGNPYNESGSLKTPSEYRDERLNIGR